MAAIKTAAFQDSPMDTALWPPHLRQKPGLEDRVDWGLACMREALSKPMVHFVVAVDATPAGDVVAGYAEWISPKTEPKKQGGQERKQQRLPLPISLDEDAMKKGNEEIRTLLGAEECKEAFRGRELEKMWTLNSIAVDSGYRGRGLGKMLTMWGMDEADQACDEIWLIASPSGRGMYESLGFKQVAAGERFGEGQFVMTKFKKMGQ
ncbi:hypothetical protein QQS21_012915 [Conoideocrella luteorostrata]|uniref:N-acetyltransferase domain-containing protein n=1 Tax=Conoideocrella luteorostrata TaxID=1105319 RepID=A0AAJ0CAL9_9HYPO|nr:hypothetical protein QQS21_012915 [Conoideocrella luteorostrata]